MKAPTLRIGLFGIGLDAYWPQFPGLKDRLTGYVGQVAARLERPGAVVVNLGLVDNAERAQAAGRQFRREDVDIIFLHATTYALSSTVLPVVQRAKVPVVVLNLAPAAAIDFAAFNAIGDRASMTGEWLAHCSSCPVPEIANVLLRAGVNFHQVTGVLDEADGCWREVAEWVDGARAAACMASNRLGLMGHPYGGMLDVQSDATLQAVTFGTHIEHLEVDELSALRRAATQASVAARVGEFRGMFDVDPGCTDADLAEAGRTSVALDGLVETHRLGSLAYYYKGSGVAENEATMASIIPGCSLLTARGVPTAGEYEVKNAQAMKIMDALGAGGSFSEFYAMDFGDDVVLMGHDGPGHVAIAQGRARIRPLGVYHGKVGRGVSVEMSVRHGPVTMLSVVERPGGRLGLLFAEAQSVPGPILEIGNTNSRYRFACGARAFMGLWNRHGPAHHCAIGVGSHAGRLEKLGLLLGIEAIRAC
jgi:L-arabinose isomerase